MREKEREREGGRVTERGREKGREGERNLGGERERLEKGVCHWHQTQ